jgi:phosphate:Na+ symporter
VISEVLGGIGLFLLGMILMTEGLQSAAGDALRRVLERLTGGPWRAMLSGAGVTMLVQSSSATTLATIGFVSAGLLTFPQAIGLVFGASLGTTSTGWIVSMLGLKLSMGAVALPLIGVGALARLLLRGRPASLGLALAGFGAIFVGIDTLVSGMGVLAERFDAGALPADSWSGRLLLGGIGIVMAVVMQSSSAAVATTLAALHAGTIGLPAAAALVIGHNVGTTATSAVAAIGASVPARRTALAHVLFNAFTGAVAFAILPVFLWAVRRFDLVADASTIALFHTSFNVLGVALLLPFTRPFAAAIVRWIPDRGSPLTRHLDPSVAGVPSLAIATSRRTALEVAVLAVSSLEAALRTGARQVARTGELEAALLETRDFLQRVRTSAEAADEQRRHVALLHVIDHLDQIVAASREIPPPDAFADPGVRDFTDGLLDALAAMREWTASPETTAPVAALERVAREVAEQRRGNRQQILRRTAAGEISPAAADRRLGAVRWIDGLAHHLWRAALHLEGGRASLSTPGEAFAEPEHPPRG